MKSYVATHDLRSPPTRKKTNFPSCVDEEAQDLPFTRRHTTRRQSFVGPTRQIYTSKCISPTTLEHYGFLTQWNDNNSEKMRDPNHS